MTTFDDLAAEGIDANSFYVHITGPLDLIYSCVPDEHVWVWVSTFNLMRKVDVGDEVMLEDAPMNGEHTQRWLVKEALSPEGASEVQKIRLYPLRLNTTILLQKNRKLIVIPHK